MYLVNALGQTDLLHLPSDDLNLIGEPVGLDDLLGRLHDPTHVHPDHLGSTCLGTEHGEDAGAAADVEDHLVLEEVLVVPDGVAVGEGSHLQQNA